MVDDDEFDGLSGSICAGCGNPMPLLRRSRVRRSACDDCGEAVDAA